MVLMFFVIPLPHWTAHHEVRSNPVVSVIVDRIRLAWSVGQRGANGWKIELLQLERRNLTRLPRISHRYPRLLIGNCENTRQAFVAISFVVQELWDIVLRRGLIVG